MQADLLSRAMAGDYELLAPTGDPMTYGLLRRWVDVNSPVQVHVTAPVQRGPEWSHDCYHVSLTPIEKGGALHVSGALRFYVRPESA